MRLIALTLLLPLGCSVGRPLGGDAGASFDAGPGADSGPLGGSDSGMGTDAGLPADAGSTVADFYVSPAGTDSAGCGTLAAPCQTVAYTQPLVRALVQSNPGRTVTVLLRGNAGPFWLSAPLAFGASDSSATNPVVWAAFPSEQPVLSGGVQVSGAWTGAAAGSGKVWTTPLPAGTVDFGQLFLDGVRLYTPRAPTTNPSGYLYNAGPVCVASTDPTYVAANCKLPTTKPGVCPNAALPYECYDRFQFSGTDISATWSNLTVNGTHPIILDDFEDWTVPKLRLASVSGNIAYLTGPTEEDAMFHGYLAGHRYLVENVKDALTATSGNWYLDASTTPWQLQYFTTGGDDPNSHAFVYPQLTQLLVATGIQNLSFRGLTFSHDNWTVPAAGYASVQAEPAVDAAVSFVDASHSAVEGCIFAHVGGYALELKGSGSQSGTGSNRVAGSAFYDIGAGGIRVGMPAARNYNDAQETGGNTVENNLVTAVGRVVPGAPLIFVGNSDNNVIQFNELYDGYGDGISVCVPTAALSCVEYGNLFQYNHVHHIKQGVTSDGGGIYLFSYNITHTSTPNVIAYNWVHDVNGDPGPGGYGGEGLYLDNKSTNVQVHHNLVYRSSSRPMFVNTGYGNTLFNNIFAYGRKGLIGRGTRVPTDGPLATPAFVAQHNVFLWDTNVTTAATTPLTFGPWDCFGSAANCVGQFDFQSNVYWNPGSGVQPQFLIVPDAGVDATVVGLSTWQGSYGEDPGSVFADPQFTNAACPQDDYSFSSTRTVTGVGFVPFDGKDAGRDAPVLTVPSVAPAFPLQLPANPCTYD